MIGSRGYVFEVDDELTEDNILALVVTTPSGDKVRLWAEVELIERTAVLRQFYIWAEDMEPGGLGAIGPRRMAQAALEEFDVDCIRIEGAHRTSGANPGRTVGALEFRRRAGSVDPDTTDHEASR